MGKAVGKGNCGGKKRSGGAEPNSAHARGGKRKRVYLYEPVGVDVFDARPNQPEPGTRVIKTQPYGAPGNGTMGHCFVKDAESGQFYGLVLEASLKATGESAVERDLAAEARDRRSAALRGS